MANTRPAIETIEKAAALKERSDVLGLVDLYPVLSLTKNLEGKELSEITAISPGGAYVPLMLSEDGKDLADDDLFLGAMKEAKRIGRPMSCHCDCGGEEAESAKKAGQPRGEWSKIEENNAVRRVIELGKKAGCHIHIAHVSTKEAAEMIRQAKAELAAGGSGDGFTLTCEAMPHNLCLTEEDAAALGAESWGRVNPPLRSEADRKALIQAVADGTVDAIATDHAPHRNADKEAGAAGFSGFETAFAAAYTQLVRPIGPQGSVMDMKRLSSLMSAQPARLLGFGGGRGKRGRILPDYRADLVIIDTGKLWIADMSKFKTRGKNSAFAGRELFGKILMTLHEGRVVFQEGTLFSP
jgi:dihydroorotase